MADQRQFDAQRILDRFDPMGSSVQDLCDTTDQHRRQYNLNKALLLCSEGLNAAVELGNQQAEGICLLHRWAVNYIGQWLPEAIEDCKQGKSKFEGLGESFSEINASIALGMTYEAQGTFLKSRGLDARSTTAFQNAMRAYRYDTAQDLVNQTRRKPSRSRGAPTADQYEELLEELKGGFQRVMNRYVQTAPAVSAKPLGDLISIPVLAQPISAGKPIPTLDDVDEYAQIIGDRAGIGSNEYKIHLLGVGRGSGFSPSLKDCCYLIAPVAGDSMDRTDIQNTDLVFLRRSKAVPISPTSGDIVAAVIQGEDRYATLKRYVERAGKLVLSAESSNPANKSYEFSAPDFGKRVHIVGIAAAVLKKVSS